MKISRITTISAAAMLAAGCGLNIPFIDRGDEPAEHEPPPVAIVQEPRIATEIHDPEGTVTRTPPATQYMVSGLWRWSPKEGEWVCTRSTCDPGTKPSYQAVENQQIKEAGR